MCGMEIDDMSQLKLGFKERALVLFTGELPKTRSADSDIKVIANESDNWFSPELSDWLHQRSETEGKTIDEIVSTTLASAMNASGNPTTDNVSIICSRFRNLFEDHEIGVFDIPLLIKSKEIARSSLSDDNKLIDVLDDVVLKELSDLFNVEVGWLKGQCDQCNKKLKEFKVYKRVGVVAAQLAKLKLRGERIQVQFIVGSDSENTAYDLARGDAIEGTLEVGVIFTRTKVVNNKEVKVYSISGAEPWSYSKCRKHFKLLMMYCKNVDIDYGGLTISKSDFNKVFYGNEPAVNAKKLNRQTWSPSIFISNETEHNPDYDEFEGIKTVYGTREQECSMSEIEFIERAYRYPHTVNRKLFEDGLYKESLLEQK